MVLFGVVSTVVLWGHIPGPLSRPGTPVVRRGTMTIRGGCRETVIMTNGWLLDCRWLLLAADCRWGSPRGDCWLLIVDGGVLECDDVSEFAGSGSRVLLEHGSGQSDCCSWSCFLVLVEREDSSLSSDIEMGIFCKK